VTRVAAAAGAAALLCACNAHSAPGASAGNVFVIVMENHSPEEALEGAYTAALAAEDGVAQDYHAITHPSVPNYLALTSGQTWGVQDDSYHVLPRQDLGDQLTQAGIPWRAYMEGLGDAGCLDSPEPYDPGHNPFAFYGGACPRNVVPFTDLGPDLAHGDTRFSWIGPDTCHDEHSCPVATGDQWLRDTVGLVTASAAWKPASVLFITWDEDDGSAGNRVLTLVVRPGHTHVVSQVAYDHYSLLATIEEMLGLPRLANAAHAQPMNDLIS
jgi:phosphatidylinositol-3-phosphatase